MDRILYLTASPRPQSSSSRAAGIFFSSLLENGSGQVQQIDLWRADLPSMSGDLIDAKYATLMGSRHSEVQAKAWSRVEQWVSQLIASDRLVISTPMWNFGVPYVLKHWIDVVTQPRLTFSFSPDIGYRPLLRDRPALVIISSSGDYRLGESWGRPDLATPYLRAALGFVGIKDITFVGVGPTAGPAGLIEKGAKSAERELREVAELWTADMKELAQ